MDGVHGSALVSYNAGISACEKGGQWQQSLSLLSEMRDAKMEPDVIYSTLPDPARARKVGDHCGDKLAGRQGPEMVPREAPETPQTAKVPSERA